MSAQVSIIIPCYNAFDTIEEAIRSALDQTYQSIEVIVVDDASTDDTPKLLRQLSLIDQRLKITYNAQNAGPSGARNVGISMASGEWLALLDADDIYEPDRIQTLMEVGLSTGGDLVADNIYVEEYPSGKNRAVAFSFDRDVEPIELDLYSLLASRIPANELDFGYSQPLDFGYLQPMIKRSFLVEHGLTFSTKYPVGEDFLLFAECLLRGARFVAVPKPGYIYRRRKGSLTLSGKDNNTISSELNHELTARLEGRLSPAEFDALIMYQRLIDQTIEYDRVRAALLSGMFWRASRSLLSHPLMIRIALRRLGVRVRRLKRNLGRA